MHESRSSCPLSLKARQKLCTCRAWQICAGCVADDDKGALHSSMFKESFGYLFGRLKTLSQPPNADLGKIPDNMVPLELPKRLMQLSEAATSGS